MSDQVVWFKRDLRRHDHTALSLATANGPLLCLYVTERSLMRRANQASRAVSPPLSLGFD